MFDDMIEAKEVAKLIKQGPDFVQRRMTIRTHPEFIPNVKIGRKRFVASNDLQAWVEKRKAEIQR